MLNIKQIQEIIPHRHPFLLIDYIEDYEAWSLCCWLQMRNIQGRFF